MIDRAKVVPLGHLCKPHGVKGELAAALDIDVCGDADLPPHIFALLDGLLVPFTLSGVRPKSSETILLTLKGIDSEDEAAKLAGAPVFIEKQALPDDGAAEGDDDDVVYLEDLDGYSVYDGDTLVGTITGYDDSTDNVLFTITTPGGADILVPAADDLIYEIDENNSIVRMSLPKGLLDL